MDLTDFLGAAIPEPSVRSEDRSAVSGAFFHRPREFFEQIEAVLRPRTRLRMELNGKHRPVDHPDAAVRAVEQ